MILSRILAMVNYSIGPILRLANVESNTIFINNMTLCAFIKLSSAGRSCPNAPNEADVLRDAATAYKVDTNAVTSRVKQEFPAKAKKLPRPFPKAKEAV
jgi:hypothetical protein